MGSPRAGSNPARSVIFPSFFFFIPSLLYHAFGCSIRIYDTTAYDFFLLSCNRVFFPARKPRDCLCLAFVCRLSVPELRNFLIDSCGLEHNV